MKDDTNVCKDFSGYHNGEDLDQSVHAQKLTRSAKLYMIS